MIDGNTEVLLQQAISEEKKAAIFAHGKFNSHSEGWAVLLEECEEVCEAAKVFERDFKSHIIKLWGAVRNDMRTGGNTAGRLREIRKLAVNIAQEAVQVAAVCDKWLDKLEKERGNNAKDM